METTEKINKILTEHFSVDHHAAEPPPLSAFANARKMVRLYKPLAGETEDFFALLAAFLNLKVKLYHAVIATILIYAAVLFFSREKSSENNELSTTEKVSNLATVRNSTVCSSIQTFISPK